MRVLTTGRVVAVTALVLGVRGCCARPARLRGGDGSGRRSRGGNGRDGRRHPGSAPGRRGDRPDGRVALGPAVKYVRKPDGTVQRVR